MSSSPSPAGVIQADAVRTVSCYKWIITDFSAKQTNVREREGDYIESPTFSTTYPNVDQHVSWKIRLHLNPKSSSYQGYLVCELIGWNKDTSRGTIITELFILTTENKKLMALIKGPLDTWLVTQDFLVDEKHGILSDDKLTIACEVTVQPSADEGAHSQIEISVALEYPYRIEVCDDFEKLFENGTASDVTLTADNKEFHVHKSVLMARCPVFRAMFAHDILRENDNTIVNIEGIKCEIFEELLRFIYAGKVNEIEKIAVDLLVAADKYAVQGLKIMCENLVCEGLTVNNVLKYLRLANTNNARMLKSHAISFITLNWDDFVGNPEFKSLATSHPDLMFDILCASMQKKANVASK